MPEALARPEDKGLTYSGIRDQLIVFFYKNWKPFLLPRNVDQHRSLNTAERKSIKQRIRHRRCEFYSLRIPTAIFDMLKYERGQETESFMRDLISTVIAKHWGIKEQQTIIKSKRQQQ